MLKAILKFIGGVLCAGIGFGVCYLLVHFGVI